MKIVVSRRRQSYNAKHVNECAVPQNSYIDMRKNIM